MTIEETLAERRSRYGDFTDRAHLAQALQGCMTAPAYGWARMSPDKRQALTVIADKIARILTGDPEYRDNWHDIQGYAKLAEDRCKDGKVRFDVREGFATVADSHPRTLYEKVVDRTRPTDPFELAGLRIATENAIDMARKNQATPVTVLLALTRALQELDNQKKDD